MVSAFDHLLRALECRDRLLPHERARLMELPHRLVSFKRGEEIISQHSRPKESCLVVRGWAGRELYLREGARQVAAVHVAGDFVDLHGLMLKLMDHSVTALSGCQVAFVAHRDLYDLMAAEPHITRMFWLMTAIDAGVERAWVACMGRRSASAHLAHLICETYLRLEAIGLAEQGRFDFPVSQPDLGDMLGISAVHANRVLQELRAEGLVTWRGATVTIPVFDRLAAFAEFDPTYLNLFSEPR